MRAGAPPDSAAAEPSLLLSSVSAPLFDAATSVPPSPELKAKKGEAETDAEYTAANEGEREVKIEKEKGRMKKEREKKEKEKEIPPFELEPMSKVKDGNDEEEDLEESDSESSFELVENSYVSSLCFFFESFPYLLHLFRLTVIVSLRQACKIKSWMHGHVFQLPPLIGH